MERVCERGLVLFLLYGLALLDIARGHGRLIEPPSRSSMWRFGFNTEPNYNDNELFCGGFTVQFSSNDGQCGICGDNYQLPQPRPNEAGGKYGKGIIVRHYKQGQTITARIELTANHQGYFEFKLCPNNNPKKIATQECLDQYPLEVVGTGSSKYVVPNGRPGFFDVPLQLPLGLTCSQCVLQWRYTSGNNWGTCGNGTGAIGCGPQETFMGCADVDVGQSGESPSIIPSRPQKPITGWLESSDDYTVKSVPVIPVVTQPPVTVPKVTQPPIIVPKVTQPPIVVPKVTTKSPSKKKNRNKTRRPNKKPTKKPTMKPRLDLNTVTVVGQNVCRSAGAYKGVPGMDNWCITNCAAGFCPPSHCSC